MLAICSDLDETPDKNSYFELMRFLNTAEETACGSGVDLEIGNSIYFSMPKGQFSYWNTDEDGRQKIHALIHSGHIDCLHSFGDLLSTRKEVAEALVALDKNGCKLKVWVDHAVAPTNFGPDIMQGHGDEVGHPAYHADLTYDYGIRYVWTGRVTSVIGQDRPFSLRGIANWKHPQKSIDTLLREEFKHILGRFKPYRYAMHVKNNLISKFYLRDGRQLTGFCRCNPHWGGISSCDRGDGIHEVLTKKFLERLIERQGMCILYTHLGKNSQNDSEPIMGHKAVAAFRLLYEYYHEKKILVTTTRKMLDYISMRDTTQVMVGNGSLAGGMSVNIKTPLGGKMELMLDGLSLQVPEKCNEITINGMSEVRYNSHVCNESKIISIPWSKLSFPQL